MRRAFSLRGLGLVIVVAAFVAAPFPAFARPPSSSSWTASGTFRYQDREWDSSGFTGTVVERPLRFADVEVLDANAGGKKALLSKGKTDGNGFFAVNVSDKPITTRANLDLADYGLEGDRLQATRLRFERLVV